MIKRFLLLLLTALPLWAAAQRQIINDENAVPRDIGSFHAVKISSPITLFLSQGEREVLVVSASEEKFRDLIRTEVRDGELHIWFDNKNNLIRNNQHLKLRVYLSFKELDKLQVSGASTVVVSGTLAVNQLSLDMSGASDFKGNVELGSLNVKVSGASDAVVSGKAGTVTIDANGASDFKGYELQSDQCSVTASGASDVKITVNKELNARASGASSVYYKGEGVVKEMKSSGASTVGKRS
ncbi:MAG: DUF2807 domain-containing protein [Candidatus Pseudobacter hemicellulosilyticus]|uniref:DUF2807 domain-containing protein n=1 Tax=Candidatus Pseudobacter hemicellulosilyticus TaxID=3121375 RepID=A0AAJ5WXK9_9BACT|nr:MAG: DUF2807 domain-containing protein [Pseudobacter sp.]